MPALTANVRVFHSYVEPQKLDNLYFIVHSSYVFCSFETSGNSAKKNLSTFKISFLNMSTLCQHFLSLDYWQVRKDWNIEIVLSFLFLLCYFQLTWLANIGKYLILGFLGCWSFLEHDCLLTMFKASSGSNGKHGFSGLLFIDVICLLCTPFESCWLTHIVDPTGILCSWGIWMLFAFGQQGKWTHL